MIRHKKILGLAFAFLKKDVQTTFTYKVFFVGQIFSIFLQVFLFYYISRMFYDEKLEIFTKERFDYFQFVIIGLALNNYFVGCIAGSAQFIRESQLKGILEILFSSPHHPLRIILFSNLWYFIFPLFHLLLVFIIA